MKFGDTRPGDIVTCGDNHDLEYLVVGAVELALEVVPCIHFGGSCNQVTFGKDTTCRWVARLDDLLSEIQRLENL